MVPKLVLSFPTCLATSQYDILNFLLKKMTITYPLVASKIETLHANKMRHFTCYYEPMLK
jgi:hypothetical protein